GAVARASLALNDIYPSARTLTLDVETGQLAVVLIAGGVEVEPARQRVAPPGSVECLGEGDHLRDVVGRLRPKVRLVNPQPAKVGLKRLGVVVGDLPNRALLAPRCKLEFVVAYIRVGRQMADIGDVDDVVHAVSLPPQRPL